MYMSALSVLGAFSLSLSLSLSLTHTHTHTHAVDRLLEGELAIHTHTHTHTHVHVDRLQEAELAQQAARAAQAEATQGDELNASVIARLQVSFAE